MTRKGEGGQALILVLILLVVGALLIIPALRLTFTGLKSSQIVTSQVKALYAAESAQEYVMWKLIYDDFASEFTYDGQEAYLQFNCCGTLVDILVIMRATVAKGAIILATDDVIQPTKSVIPATVPDGNTRTYTYYIRLEQLSDNTSQGLDAVYDILPGELSGLAYVPGSSKLRVDGGEWQNFGDPSIVGPAAGYGNYRRLRWPASGVFDSPMRDFAVRQVKEIQFQVSGSLSNNRNYVNWVVLDPWDSLSGPQALLTVGSPSNPDIWGTAGMFEVGKVAEPEIIPSGVEADIKYTINITNHESSTEAIREITDYLPPGFFYTDGSTSGDITTNEPQISLETLNGVERQVLRWTSNEIPAAKRSFAAGQTKTLVFWARTIKDVSGNYYNEVQARSDLPVPKIVYEIIGPTTAEDSGDREAWNMAYSWATGTVIVPTYDSRTTAETVTIDANMSLLIGTTTINSWEVE